MRAFVLVLCLAARVAVGEPTNDEERKPGEIRVGDKAYISVPLRRGLAITTFGEREYKEMLWAIRRSPKSALQIRFHKIQYRSPGYKVKIVELHDDPSFALPVPAAVVLPLPEDEGNIGPRIWIPLQYLRHPSDPHPKGEFRLPSFIPANAEYRPRPGEIFVLYNSERRQVPVAFKVEDIREWIRFAVASDRESQARFLREKRVALAEEEVDAEAILMQPTRIGKKTYTLVECKILSGSLEGKSVWISAFNATRLSETDLTTSVHVYVKWLTEAEIKAAWKDWDATDGGGKSPNASDGEASKLLGMAKGLERSKKPAAALKYYERIVREYPDSREAKVAKEKIRKLKTEGK